MARRLLKWFLCIFVIPLSPFIIGWAMIFMSDPNAKISSSFLRLPPFWERGEFLILAIAIAASGFGDLWTSRPSEEFPYPAWGILVLKIAKGLAATCSAVVFCGSFLIYVAVSACLVHGKAYNIAFVTQWSPIIFIFSAVVGLACVALSKET
jgi:hypothetical protein